MVRFIPDACPYVKSIPTHRCTMYITRCCRYLSFPMLSFHSFRDCVQQYGVPIEAVNYSGLSQRPPQIKPQMRSQKVRRTPSQEFQNNVHMVDPEVIITSNNLNKLKRNFIDFTNGSCPKIRSTCSSGGYTTSSYTYSFFLCTLLIKVYYRWMLTWVQATKWILLLRTTLQR